MATPLTMTTAGVVHDARPRAKERRGARRRRVRGSRREVERKWLRGEEGKAKGEKGGKGKKAQRKKSEVAVACYNIRDGRNLGLLSAARALDHANVDVAVLQEVKLRTLNSLRERGSDTPSSPRRPARTRAAEYPCWRERATSFK